MKSTANKEELDKFQAMSKDWWNEEGKFKPLHLMNPTRILYIKNQILKHYNTSSTTAFAGLKMLDIGCGGGLLSEPMARLGGDVTGIDALAANIKVAKIHSLQMNLDINYITTTVEEFAPKHKNKFDVILCMEIIEHVDNPDIFINHAVSMLKNGGIIFFSTINRTMKSYVLAIIGAEYILRWLPVGTHDWNKFFKPSELNKMLNKSKSSILDIKGMKYNPISETKWSLRDDDLDVNYILCATKA